MFQGFGAGWGHQPLPGWMFRQHTGASMQNITIGRAGAAETLRDEYPGWIEGHRHDGTGWILWLGADGAPTVYFPHRDESGAVVGGGIDLTDRPEIVGA